MHTLKQMLTSSEPYVLAILAERWGVNTRRMSHDEIVTALEQSMLDPARAEVVFDTLSDAERGALQALLGSGGQMNTKMFTLLYGEIRAMGQGKAEREKPHENPANIAEALYYRGLISKTFDQVGVGIGSVVYVPDDLTSVLPIHKTGYNADVLESLSSSFNNPQEQIYIQSLEEERVTPTAMADTSIVDDMTTLLAFIQLSSPLIVEHMLSKDAVDTVTPFFMVEDVNRLNFMFQIALTAEMIEIQNQHAFTRRADVRRWLEDSRPAQLRFLIEAWRQSTHYGDLWHTQGLYFDADMAGASYDPVEARGAIISVMREYLRDVDWWGIGDFVDIVKAIDPDFQRPGGDYESWYIRDEMGEYLKGFEDWDTVEGAVIEHYITGPLHWLGLVDLGMEVARLNTYGRAFLEFQPRWPDAPADNERIVFQNDGTLAVSRKVSRFERFQLARFATWMNPATLNGEPYIYRLDADSLARASEQGINVGHIQAFLSRHLEDKPMPPKIERLLETWGGGDAIAQVTMERMIVLRTTSSEIMDSIYNSPPLRRYLGARLGPTAVAVRPETWDALRVALGENRITTEVRFD